MKKEPCKGWEIASVFHRIEKTDFHASIRLFCSGV